MLLVYCYIKSQACAGSLYQYMQVAGEWSSIGKLYADDGASGDCFGHSVAINTCNSNSLIGAPYADSGVGMET
jgi:hypothetical protein